MSWPDLKRQATAEIDEYRAQLVPAELVVQQMGGLALALRELAPAEAREPDSILRRVAIYLERVNEWPDVDPRLRLDCVCTLCWTKRGEALEALPAELCEQIEGDWATQDDLLAIWAAHHLCADRAGLARMLLWWAVANLVSNAAHLRPGEANELLQPLLQAFALKEQGPVALNMLN